MKVVLVGVDGSKASEAALVWAARLAGGAGAEVVVATAVWPSGRTPSPSLREDRVVEATRRLEEWARPVGEEGVEYRPVVLEGQPEVLLAFGDSEDADLLVVGTRGAGGFAGLHLGSVAHHLVHHTNRPLAVIPASDHTSFGSAVLGVDGSEGAAEAVRWCADALGPLGTTVYAVNAFTPLLEWVPKGDHRRWHHHAMEQVRRWTAPLDEAGLHVVPVVVPGIHPVAALTRVAEEHHAGMVVVGSRGLGGFAGLRLGQVPLQLVQRTALPTVLVPPRNS